MISRLHRWITAARRQNQRVTGQDITLFLRQLAVLVNAGAPVSRAFIILEQSQEINAMRILVHAINRDLRAGKNLFQSLRRYPAYFDELSCRLTGIGEHTGKLDTVLNIIAARQENILESRRRLRQALFYPCILAAAAILVTLAMFIFVIPRFAELFADASLPLPALTRVIFALSAGIRRYGMLFCAAAAVLYACRRKYFPRLLKLPGMRLPFIRNFTRKILLAGFARHIAICYQAGLPVTDALRLAAPAEDSEIAGEIALLRKRVSSGLQLHQAMESLPFFTPLFRNMIKIGEESGMLAEMLDKTADFFTAEIQETAERANQLLEPLIMLVLGVLIGVIMTGMYLPLFKLGSAI